MFKPSHVNTSRNELDALKFEPRALLMCGCSAQLDLTTCAEHTMPGQAVGRISAQQPSHGAMVPRIPC